VEHGQQQGFVGQHHGHAGLGVLAAGFGQELAGQLALHAGVGHAQVADVMRPAAQPLHAAAKAVERQLPLFEIAAQVLARPVRRVFFEVERVGIEAHFGPAGFHQQPNQLLFRLRQVAQTHEYVAGGLGLGGVLQALLQVLHGAAVGQAGVGQVLGQHAGLQLLVHPLQLVPEAEGVSRSLAFFGQFIQLPALQGLGLAQVLKHLVGRGEVLVEGRKVVQQQPGPAHKLVEIQPRINIFQDIEQQQLQRDGLFYLHAGQLHHVVFHGGHARGPQRLAQGQGQRQFIFQVHHGPARGHYHDDVRKLVERAGAVAVQQLAGGGGQKRNRGGQRRGGSRNGVGSGQGRHWGKDTGPGAQYTLTGRVSAVQGSGWWRGTSLWPRNSFSSFISSGRVWGRGTSRPGRSGGTLLSRVRNTLAVASRKPSGQLGKLRFRAGPSL